MALSKIQVGGQSVTLVDMPAEPAFRSVQFDMSDPAIAVVSGFTGQTQVQRWPGADSLSATLSLPYLTPAQADEWIAFLMACRGQANAFLLGDPMKCTVAGDSTRKSVRGNIHGSHPVVDGSVATNNLPGSDQLFVRGLSGAGRLLEAGDWIGLGYRHYRNLFPVLMSPNGTATLTVYPTIREQPQDGTPLVVKNVTGLYRLATPQRSWNADYRKLTSLSFQAMEWRGAASA